MEQTPRTNAAATVDLPGKSLGYHSDVDDEEIAAFIEGWNAALEGEDDFDLALHFWMRRRCGI